jgi:DNA-binding response OmpR family regulator
VSQRILVVEDEDRIAAFVEKGLRASGYTTTRCSDGDTAVAIARDDAFDLVVLDLGLPGRGGLEVLQAIRDRGESLPVVVLTARDGVDATVASFEGGADDFLAKPFRFEELLARVRARLRTRPDGTTDTLVLATDGVALDLRTRRATVAGRAVELSAREFALAEALMRHPGQVLSREQLLDRVWGYAFDPGSNIVEVYVGYLRRKLGPASIETVRGMGYRMPEVGASQQ